MNKICLICGVILNQNKERDKKYCSHKCYWKSLVGKKHTQEHRNKISRGNARPTYVKCQECDKSFKVARYHTLNPKYMVKFCSKDCLVKSGVLHNTGRTRFKKGHIPSITGKHHNEESNQRNRLKHLGKHHSPKTEFVKGKHYSPGTEFKKGLPPEQNYNWKGGLSFTLQGVRTCQEYKEWRISIFKRDNYMCQICGLRGKPIVAHHKKRFSHIVSESIKKFPLLKIYDSAKFYKPFWDINNGITLCAECHKKIHKK